MSAALPCAYCSKTFTSEFALESHLASSHGFSIASVVGVPPARRVSRPTSNPFYCTTCKLQCTSQRQLADHKKGQKHKLAPKNRPVLPKKATRPSPQSKLTCQVCGVCCETPFQLKVHKNSGAHVAAVQRLGRLCSRWLKTGSCHFGSNCKFEHATDSKETVKVRAKPHSNESVSKAKLKKPRGLQWKGKKVNKAAVEPQPEETKADQLPVVNSNRGVDVPEAWCALCGERVEGTVADHTATQAHRLREDLLNKESLPCEHKGVFVSAAETVLLVQGDSTVFTLQVGNRNATPQRLQRALLQRNHSCIQFTPPSSCLLTRGKSLRLRLTFLGKHIGRSRHTVICQFDTFLVARRVELRVVDAITPATEALFTQPATFTLQASPLLRQSTGHVLDAALKPPNPLWRGTAPMRPCGSFAAPQALWRAIRDGPKAFASAASVLSLPPEASVDAGCQFLRVALWVEEVQRTNDLRLFDFTAQLRRSGQHWLCTVPHLQDIRPPLRASQSITVTCTQHCKNTPSPPCWGGYIVRVQDSPPVLTLALPLCVAEHISIAPAFVRFELPRLALQRMQRALTLVERVLNNKEWWENGSGGKVPDLRRLLFPQRNELALLRGEEFEGEEKLQPINEELNAEQMQAVETIVHHTAVPSLVLSGPQCSGRSSVLVEATLQLVRADPSTRVLVCAPSQAGADLIALKLSCQMSTQTLLRLHGTDRRVADMPRALLPFCTLEPGRSSGAVTFRPPSLQDVCDAQVVCCSCIGSGLLVELGVPTGHFTHFFFDNAERALEAELLIPLAGLLGLGGRVAVAGDPSLPGPVVRSPVAATLNLGCSFLSRLVNANWSSPYSVSDSPFMVRLHSTFGIPRALVNLANGWFYAQTLLANHTAEEDSAAKSFPLQLLSVCGHEQYERRSPSPYNVDEICMVCAYVERLLQTRGVSPKDIAIVSPFSKQVEKLQSLLHDRGFNLFVASPEHYQLKTPRRFVILSCVVSAPLVGPTHRVNAALLNAVLTRTRETLVVVGHPLPLAHLSGVWSQLLHVVTEHNTLQGVSMSEATVDPEDDVQAENVFLERTRGGLSLFAGEENLWEAGTV